MAGKEKIPATIASVVVIAMLAGVAGWSSQPVKPVSAVMMAQTQGSFQSDAEEKLSKDMRKLWEDHIIWTRAYIVSAAYDNGDTQAISQRLMKNQEDIGNAVKPYYGEEAGNRLTGLLKEHINIATELVTAAKKGDQNAQNAANDKWYANANQIADFLASANPNWPKEQLRSEMREHLDLTKQAAVDILNNRYSAGIAGYDRIHRQILEMADMLSEGIVKQYPDRFR